MNKAPLPFASVEVLPDAPHFPNMDLVERLAVGELPGVAVAPAEQRSAILRSYCQAHLEEELRREALIKDWPPFTRFLRRAAAEAGQLVNYAKISRHAGVSLPTIKNYHQLLEDMFLAFRLPAFSQSNRKSLLATDRFFFADLGIRHAAAGA